MTDWNPHRGKTLQSGTLKKSRAKVKRQAVLAVEDPDEDRCPAPPWAGTGELRRAGVATAARVQI